MGRSQRHLREVKGVDSAGDWGPRIGQADPPRDSPTAPAGGPTNITLSTPTHADNLGNGQTVGTFTPTGGAGPYTYALLNNPYGTYFILGAQLKILLDPPHVEGVRSVVVQVTDGQNRTFSKAITVTVT